MNKKLNTFFLLVMLLVSNNYLRAQTYADTLYKQLNCDELSEQAFKQALCAFEYYADSFAKKQIIAIVDFSKHSRQKRFFVIDLQAKQVLYKELTTHGVNSGLEYAISFSNTVNSLQSSLGCFRVAEKDTSRNHDTVLILDGLEKDINHNARRREIIIHRSELAKSAPVQYCSQEFVDIFGYNGQSFGCPVLPRPVCKPIMDLLANGSMLYIYAPYAQYYRQTKIPCDY